MFHDSTLFDEKEQKTELITIRLTRSQKERINQMAGHKSISAFVLALIGQENERLINERLLTVLDNGMPF